MFFSMSPKFWGVSTILFHQDILNNTCTRSYTNLWRYYFFQIIRNDLSISQQLEMFAILSENFSGILSLFRLIQMVWNNSLKNFFNKIFRKYIDFYKSIRNKNKLQSFSYIKKKKVLRNSVRNICKASVINFLRRSSSSYFTKKCMEYHNTIHQHFFCWA